MRKNSVLLALIEAVIYLSFAPKSNSVYTAYKVVKDDVMRTRNEPVPMHLRNAPTGLMKGLGYGKGYKYAHDYTDALTDQEHLPDSLRGRRYYRPTERGHEARITQRMAERAQSRHDAIVPHDGGQGRIEEA